MENVLLKPVEFVALVNQTLEFAYPHVVIEGEIANFRISRNRWVYFDIKDDQASVKCFGTVYQLPGPLEEGMMLKVSGNPRLHQRFGFSLTLQSMQPSGEGSIKKAAQLLHEKLEKEGLFAAERKRSIPYPPRRIGLIASGESAAYSDFIKVMKARWQGVEILHKDVLVQGESAVSDVCLAIDYFNAHAETAVDALVITRGGGSADDLAAFSSEQITRKVAASRIPTLVAIGHERDESLAELAADLRASTPSNAAELLVPDRQNEVLWLAQSKKVHSQALRSVIAEARTLVDGYKATMDSSLARMFENERALLLARRQIIDAYDPRAALRRGYALVKTADGTLMTRANASKKGDSIRISLHAGELDATITNVIKE